MMYAGGLLFRLISDNFYNHVEESLDSLGWFQAGRNHKTVVMRPDPVDDNEEVRPNLIAFSPEDVDDEDVELGSNFSENRFLHYIDIYAESKSVGLHLAGDVRDILRGKFSGLGRTDGFDVLDLSQATPSTVLSCEIENVFMDRSRFYEKPFQKFWWVVGCELVFSYTDDVD